MSALAGGASTRASTVCPRHNSLTPSLKLLAPHLHSSAVPALSAADCPTCPHLHIPMAPMIKLPTSTSSKSSNIPTPSAAMAPTFMLLASCASSTTCSSLLRCLALMASSTTASRRLVSTCNKRHVACPISVAG